MEHGVVVAAHSSSRHFGSCVLLPHPVAPRSSATLESQMAPRMASRCSNAGRLLEVEAAAALSCGTARAGEGSAAVVALGAMDAVAAGAVAMSARAARSGAVRVNMSPDNPVGEGLSWSRACCECDEGLGARCSTRVSGKAAPRTTKCIGNTLLGDIMIYLTRVELRPHQSNLYSSNM